MGDLFGGKVVLVTGAGSGIGQAAAIAYATQGATVIVSDTEINDTVSVIKSKRGIVSFIPAEVNSLSECSRLIKNTIEKYGRLDIAFNSVGIPIINYSSADLSPEHFNQFISTHLCGVFYCMKYEIQVMLGQAGGIIINSPTILSLETADSFIGYVAAKHGVIAITENAALKYASNNLRIHCIAPQFVNAPLIETIDFKGKTTFSLQHPRSQAGKAEEIAAMALWLSSEKASLVTTGCYSGEDCCTSN